MNSRYFHGVGTVVANALTIYIYITPAFVVKKAFGKG